MFKKLEKINLLHYTYINFHLNIIHKMLVGRKKKKESSQIEEQENPNVNRIKTINRIDIC